MRGRVMGAACGERGWLTRGSRMADGEADARHAAMRAPALGVGVVTPCGVRHLPHRRTGPQLVQHPPALGWGREKCMDASKQNGRRPFLLGWLGDSNTNLGASPHNKRSTDMNSYKINESNNGLATTHTQLVSSTMPPAQQSEFFQ